MSIREREELERLTRSETLKNSPSVQRLMQYIGQSCLEGRIDELKEHTIAVELLGKPLDFDPEQDSIVRVLAHRLRRKLKLYYETEGADSTLELVLEPGQYRPHFLPRTPAPRLELVQELAVEPILPAPVPPQAPRRTRVLVGLACAVFLLVAALALTSWRKHRLPAAGPEEQIRIQAGTPPAVISVDNVGDMWLSDRWYRGGADGVAPVGFGTPLQFARSGDFNYEIPLANGPHELRLFFGRGPGNSKTRRFDVMANGVKILDALDPPALRNIEAPVVRVFRDITPGSDGKLHLAFRSRADTAFVNAIQLSPGQSGRLKAIRLIASSAPYNERSGTIWGTDRYVTGGELAARSDKVLGGLDPNLFSGERHGTFSYHIPVAMGRYKLTLYFAERWFGHGAPGGAGSRRFDVYANGIPLLKDFDIYKEAGGSNRGIRRQFPNIPAMADGYIDLVFEARVNRACVNALELEDESR
jgi:hypothetical protein